MRVTGPGAVFLFLVVFILLVSLIMSKPIHRASGGVVEEAKDTVVHHTSHGHGDRNTDWSNLVGRNGDEAMEEIKKANPDLRVTTIPQNAAVTMDFRVDRVRIFVDADNKVVRPPTIG